MFCEFCGSLIPDGSSICPTCAAPVKGSVQPAQDPVSVQPIEAVPVQPVQPVQPVYQQPVYQQPAYQQSQPIYPAAGGGSKALAIVSLVLGICGLVFCWIPFFGLLIAVAGLITGILSRKNINGKGMGTTGFILSIIGCAIGGLMLFSLLATGTSSYTKRASSVSRSLSRSLSISRSRSRASSRKKNNDYYVSADSDLFIDGYRVSF